jgi:hypothetical protein
MASRLALFKELNVARSRDNCEFIQEPRICRITKVRLLQLIADQANSGVLCPPSGRCEDMGQPMPSRVTFRLFGA